MVRIIGVVSGKGGVGKTTVVANLGATLSNNFKKDVIIVDCNITTSHLGLYIGMYYCPVTLNDVLSGRAEIKTAIYEHLSGLRLIPASLSLEDLKGVDITKLRDALNKLTSIFGKTDIILLDAAPGLGREALATLKASDEVIFVTTPYVPSIVDIIKCKQIAEESNVKSLGIVLNMAFKEKHELTVKEVEELTELPVIATIPFDKEVLRSLSIRVPVVLLNEKSRASKEIIKLAGILIGEEIKKPNFFEWLSNIFKPKPKPSRIEEIKTTLMMPEQKIQVLEEKLEETEMPKKTEIKEEIKKIPKVIEEEKIQKKRKRSKSKKKR